MSSNVLLRPFHSLRRRAVGEALWRQSSRALSGFRSKKPYVPPGKVQSTVTPSKDRMNMDMNEVRQRSTVVNQLWRERDKPTNDGARKPHAILDKSMGDSFTEAFLPFTSDRQLLDEYLTYAGTIRVGKLLEDLDALAGTIAYKHCDDDDPESQPYTVVTASVDHINLLQKLHPDRDYRLCGHVSYVGKSSMEISVLVDSPTARTFSSADPLHEADPVSEKRDVLLSANFTMVARDRLTRKAAEVNRLVPQTKEEQIIFDKGAARKKQRQEIQKRALAKLPPNEEERLIVHELWLQTKDIKNNQPPPGCVWMEDNVHQSIRMCHPQERNVHNSVFGGFLMREAFELAWMSAYQLAGTHPFFLSLDDISFRLPVAIGSVLKLTASVAYVPEGDSSAIQTDVEAEVVDPTTRTSQTTNIFHFTFTAPGPTVPRVLPRSYTEAMRYLEGRRRITDARELAKELCPDLLKYY